MKINMRGLAYSAALVAMLAAPMASQAADDKMSGDKMTAAEKVDCTKAHAMMKSASAMAPAKMTGDVDQDFATLAVSHAKMMQTMAKIEVACGKNTKVKAAASAMMAMEAKEVPILEPFRSP